MYLLFNKDFSSNILPLFTPTLPSLVNSLPRVIEFANSRVPELAFDSKPMFFNTVHPRGQGKLSLLHFILESYLHCYS